MKKFFFIISLSFFVILCSCNKSDNNKVELKTFTVTKENLHKSLYFTGIIQPIGESSLTNPVEGTIEKIHYPYGQKVKKNDIVFTVNSENLQKEFNAVLTEYLKTKDNWINAKNKFKGTEELWKEGLISKNNYESEQSSLKCTQVSLIEAKNKLATIVEKFGENNSETIENLSFKDFEQVRQTLSNKHNLLNLKANKDGILLYPPKSGDEQGKLTVGSTVKAGSTLALIGDLTGVKVEIDIPEIDIDKIKVGAAAIIRCTAFPDDALVGQIASVNSQASTTTAPLPSFSAVIEVKNLKASQQSWIKVGMSGEIEIPLSQDPRILIPREAITKNNNESIVKIQTQAGKIEQRKVEVKNVEQDKVIISSGIKAGETVVIS